MSNQPLYNGYTLYGLEKVFGATLTPAGMAKLAEEVIPQLIDRLKYLEFCKPPTWSFGNQGMVGIAPKQLYAWNGYVLADQA